MKSTLTLLAFAAATVTSAQVPNGGFEAWTTAVLYDAPMDWETGNGWDANGLVTTTQVTTAPPSGNAAVRMETMSTATDTSFGYILQGEIDNDPTGGIPWSTEIQTIEGYARYGVQPGDTAIMLFIAWSGGNIVGEDLITFVGSQSTWTAFSHPLNLGTITPDSLLIAAASSNALNEIGITPGSWLELDAIALTSINEPNPDVVPNNDFENWTELSAEDADDWASQNSLTAGFGLVPVMKSTDANSGSFSALVRTLDYEGSTLVGILTNGSIDQQGPSGGVPYIAQPTLFTGAYKYQPMGQDTGHVAVLFYNNGSLVGVSGSEFSSATTTWTTFSEPVFVGTVPDTMAIIVYAGNNAGSMLYVDDLDLSGGNVGIDERTATALTLFPNPATDRVTLFTAAYSGRASVTIMDLSGKVVQRNSLQVLTGAGGELDLRALPAGTYMVEVLADGERLRERLVKH